MLRARDSYCVKLVYCIPMYCAMACFPEIYRGIDAYGKTEIARSRGKAYFPWKEGAESTFGIPGCFVAPGRRS